MSDFFLDNSNFLMIFCIRVWCSYFAVALMARNCMLLALDSLVSARLVEVKIWTDASSESQI